MSKLNSKSYYVDNLVYGETPVACGKSIGNAGQDGPDSQVAGMVTGC
jgi:hypothetical protein